MANDHYKTKFPPLWAIFPMIRAFAGARMANRRKDYMGTMAQMRRIFLSEKFKRKSFEGYVPTVHDVFVCTYSKSGTNWMMQIVTQITGRGMAEFEHIHDIVPWPETPMPGLAKLTAPTWEDSPTQMRAIKSHAEADFIPYNDQAKYIVVVRDPKDALVSGFYFADSIQPGLKSMGLSTWTEAFLKNKVIFGPWPDHIASFWKWRDRENVLIVTFGEMKQDLEKIVRRTADVMQVDLTESEIAQVVEKSSFAYMKANEEKFEPPSPDMGQDRSEPVEIIRSGKKGESAELLSQAELDKVDREMKVQLEALGSDFPYDSYFAQQ